MVAGRRAIQHGKFWRVWLLALAHLKMLSVTEESIHCVMENLCDPGVKRRGNNPICLPGRRFPVVGVAEGGLAAA